MGFTLDPKLTWNSHINNVAMCHRLWSPPIGKAQINTDQVVPFTVYFQMFHGHIKYRLEVWSHATGWRELTVRLSSSTVYIDHCWPIFIELGVLRLYGQYILSSLSNLKLNLKKFQQVLWLPQRPLLGSSLLHASEVKRKTAFPILLTASPTIYRKIWRAQPAWSLRSASRNGCCLGFLLTGWILWSIISGCCQSV